jgi:hypothetical protein
MTIRTLAIAVALLLTGCATAPAPQAGNALQFVDLTDEFAEEWDRTASMAEAGRVSTFKERFAALLPGFYSHERFKGSSLAQYDERFLQGLRKFPQERAGIEEISRRFSSILDPARRSFEAQFGPMTGYLPIYLVHSLGEFDGGTRMLPGGVRLLFGADLMARLHNGQNVAPFFHHELFHLYHSRFFSECEPLWCGLWQEGLAIYVAAKLSPGATDAELLLTLPEPLRVAVDAHRNEAVCTALARFNSTDIADANALFSSRRLNANLPPRFGYYVGYLAVAEAGRDRTLKELAAMPVGEARLLLASSLRALETCAG